MSDAAAPSVPRSASGVDANAVLALIAVAQFMVILDATIVNVALPTIKVDVGFSEQSLSWVLNAYTLMFGGFLLLGGRAADRLGRRRLFMAGIALFSGASLVCGLAQSEGMLLASRAAQGLGGAMVSPAALSIILTTFKHGRRGVRPSRRTRVAGDRRARAQAERRHPRPAHSAGDADRAARRGGRDQPRDRCAAVHQREHRRISPAQGLPQAR